MCLPSCFPDAGNDNSDVPLPDLIADALALSERMADARPGIILAYHVGALARDCYPALSTLTEQRRVALAALADYALRLAEAGWAHLLQRRLGEERFLYLLVVTPRRPRVSMPAPPRISAVILQEAA
jgi:hypothetical protein